MIEMDAKLNMNLRGMLKQIKQELKQVPQEAYDFFVKTTPIRSGNARKQTKFQNGVIKANYPYAEVLDKGRHMTKRGMRGSEQAPEGMTKPTEEFIKNRVNKIMRGK
jgi:hypothetical protein